MHEMHLNLARKLRSKTFEQIIGQDLPVKMLKNSLFRDYYFPVYLFSGQRGCGKTTTARVFGTAINCEQLPTFQQNPRNTYIPCQRCQSCQAMNQSMHPDFFEIDAASHTGVDMMREIIDAASLLPIMGKKKIYLIDEAHMLSKAAFNALLKILEEPPASVLFILATTDPEKIIDTVRSRCFQLFFTPVDPQILASYLHEVCTQEAIAHDQGGLETIIHETEGSVRDALNLLEQIRFSSTQVTKVAVQEVLGHLDDERIVTLLQAILIGNSSRVISLCSSIGLVSYSAEFILHRMFELIRTLMFFKYDVSVQDNPFIHIAEFSELAQIITIKRLCYVSEALYHAEPVLAKTTSKHMYLEILFLQLSQSYFDNDPHNSNNNTQSVVIEPLLQKNTMKQDTEECDDHEDTEQATSIHDPWKQFIQDLSAIQDPMLISIFSQAQHIHFDALTHKLTITFNQAFSFYEDKLNEERSKWMPHLQASYSADVITQWEFTKQEDLKKNITKNIENYQKKLEQRKSIKREIKTPVLIDEKQIGELNRASLILHYFPGTLYKIGEMHETV